ncbi:MAG: hypothetical protein HGA69_00855 [Desulfobulbaceae bacterium]|nr:hypothetical protein [Desulfobulbaceae bacterium]
MNSTILTGTGNSFPISPPQNKHFNYLFLLSFLSTVLLCLREYLYSPYQADRARHKTRLRNMALLLELVFKGSTLPYELIDGKKKKNKSGKKEKPSSDLQLVYNNLAFVKPERMDDLIKDISAITGKSIQEVKIRKIDLTNGYAELDVFFNEPPGLI